MSSRWKQSKKAREWVERQKRARDWPEWAGNILGFGLAGLMLWGFIKLIKIIIYHYVG